MVDVPPVLIGFSAAIQLLLQISPQVLADRT